MTAEEDERETVALLKRGNVAAFDRLYAQFGARIYSFLLRLSGKADVAEDLAQDTWFKFAKAAPKLAEDTRLAPFLFTIARNAFISHRRWAMLDLSRFVMIGYDAIATITAPDNPEIEHERAVEIARLEAGLQRIPLASREVLLLITVEGIDQEEVAKMLGLSYDAVRQRLSRARKQLEEQIDGASKTSRA